MLQPRINTSLRTLSYPSSTPTSLLAVALTRLTLATPALAAANHPRHTRPASHASQGRANKAAPGPGKRLGAKKADSELVVPGNIIFRQRGTHWFPGENCGMGRDHTIFALERGFVRYYRDPEKHPKRKYIGVVFERGWGLPRARGECRRRRVGMDVRVMENGEPADRASLEAERGQGEILEMAVRKGATDDKRMAAVQAVPMEQTAVTLRKGYMYRESNWSIGRSAERAGVKVRVYNPKDRFLAWRKTNIRKARNAERRGLRRK